MQPCDAGVVVLGVYQAKAPLAERSGAAREPNESGKSGRYVSLDPLIWFIAVIVCWRVGWLILAAGWRQGWPIEVIGSFVSMNTNHHRSCSPTVPPSCSS